MSNDIRVTLSGNSTPLLPGCGECAALRARLAEAEARAKPGLPPEVLQALEDFEQEMREKTIPEIIQETKRRERLAAEARQRLMGEVGTEQALHHAWRKRAEEAEAWAVRAEEAVRVLAAECREHRWHVDPGHREDTDNAIRTTDANPAARAAVEGAR